MSLDRQTRALARGFALLISLLACAPALAGAISTILPSALSQGGLVVVRLRPGSRLSVAGKPVHVGQDGVAVFGAGRDEQGPLIISVIEPDGHSTNTRIAVMPRDWPIERISGLPPATVNPPAELTARIAREQAAVAAARNRDDDREDFLGGFIWPAQGRISGRFGNQRIYNGDPKAPHSGMDIAVPRAHPFTRPLPASSLSPSPTSTSPAAPLCSTTASASAPTSCICRNSTSLSASMSARARSLPSQARPAAPPARICTGASTGSAQGSTRCCYRG